MNKKVGKFKMWQLIAAGVALGVIIYIYSKNKGGTTEPEYGYLTGTESGEPVLPGGSSGGGGTTTPGSGIAETLGILEALKNAGLIPSNEGGKPEREVIETETPGPEPKTNAEVRSAHIATVAARKAEHKAEAQLQKAKAAAKGKEHRSHQKSNSTGGNAHVPNTHTGGAHPAHAIGQAKAVSRAKTHNNNPAKQASTQNRRRRR